MVAPSLGMPITAIEEPVQLVEEYHVTVSTIPFVEIIDVESVSGKKG